jgi:hypothetical protein
MRGSPLFRALVAFLVIALLGWPLWRLTRATESVRTEEVAASVQPVHLAFSFTLAPQGVKVRHLGKEVWAAANPSADIEHDLMLPWPKEGIDLQIQIDWPAAAPLAAAQVTVTDPTGHEHLRSIFSKGPADEVLTFP